jgi:hypothetical protein
VPSKKGSSAQPSRHRSNAKHASIQGGKRSTSDDPRQRSIDGLPRCWLLRVGVRCLAALRRVLEVVERALCDNGILVRDAGVRVRERHVHIVAAGLVRLKERFAAKDVPDASRERRTQ